MTSIASIEQLGQQASFKATPDLSPLADDAALRGAFASGNLKEIQRLAGSTKPMMMVLIPADEEDGDGNTPDDGDSPDDADK